MSDKFDPFGGLFKGSSSYLRTGMDVARWMDRRAARKQLETRLRARSYMPSTIADCHKAIKDGEPWERIEAMLAADLEIQNRKRAQDAFIKNPPKVHGDARFDRPTDLSAGEHQLLYDFSKVPERGDAIYLGGLSEGTPQGAFPKTALHWSGQSHLITLAPTRTGKAVSQIIPNLLRYRGSVVVVDPKGELFKATSKWRSENVGPVWLLNPFDIDGLRSITHAINPLDAITTDDHADALANLLMPPAREVDDFFEAECKSFLGAAILYFALHMPEEHRSLGTLRDMVSGLRSDQTRSLIEDMSRPDLDPMIMNRMRSFHGKDMGKSVSRLSDTLDTVLKLFDNRGIREVTSRSDFSFAELKKEPATVYITIPFQRIKSHGRYVTMLLNMALDALESSQRPQIPVLMLFDEFLSFPRSDTILSALRTHAGAGVRMWFFLQDINALAHIYPNNWKSFLQAEVECYFGTDDHFTAKMVSEFLGTTTRVVVGGNASGRACRKVFLLTPA
ncbi:putative VirD4/TraG family protein [Roseibium sp. TrichSKD4]|uniref:type IV secretory system conjugative DNA transfer family protein n=1 Tax=Roseibium sp. TrichSKD4 TaxID=744980 RepID=UPI0001E5712A|nr:type IV secretory system conjugative DNA transfer family protein [Roseibium sp. TrichSKD4]EFO28692.1 putative VirD4/TraG family protein [Roseibium sp. TrichSKD4]